MIRNILIAVFMLTLAGCGMFAISPASGYIAVASQDRCIRVTTGVGIGDAPFFKTKTDCETFLDAGSGKKNINEICDEDIDCASGNCAADHAVQFEKAGFGFCEPALTAEQNYIECFASNKCLAERFNANPSTTCEDIGFYSDPADTCYKKGEFCGDGILTGVEECDGTVFHMSRNCVDWGEMINIPFTGGRLACTDSCLIDDTVCELKFVKDCDNIEGAYCGTWNHNPFKYTPTDKVVYCDNGKTCYVPKGVDPHIYPDDPDDPDGPDDPDDPDNTDTCLELALDGDFSNPECKDTYLKVALIGIVGAIVLVMIFIMIGILFSRKKR